MLEWLESLKFWKSPVPQRVVSEEEFRQWSSLNTWVGDLLDVLDSIEDKWNSYAGRNFNDLELLKSTQRLFKRFGVSFSKVKKIMNELGVEHEFTETLATLQLEYKYLDKKHPKRSILAQLQLVRKTVNELKEEIKKLEPKRPSVFN
ncbi:MAG: hypothetical protein ABIG93_04775 [archaeon]